MVDYIGRRMREGVPLKSITRHMMGLFHGEPGARSWRRVLSEEARLFSADAKVLWKAASFIDAESKIKNRGLYDK